MTRITKKNAVWRNKICHNVIVFNWQTICIYLCGDDIVESRGEIVKRKYVLNIVNRCIYFLNRFIKTNPMVCFSKQFHQFFSNCSASKSSTACATLEVRPLFFIVPEDIINREHIQIWEIHIYTDTSKLIT